MEQRIAGRSPQVGRNTTAHVAATAHTETLRDEAPDSPRTSQLEHTDIMGIGPSLVVLSALLIGSEHALAQEVTVSGRLLASSLVRNHYVQTYTIDSRPDNPLRSVQVSSTDFDAVLIVVSPDGTVYSDDDSAGESNARLRIAPRTGEWLIVVTAYELRRPGAFSLTVDGPPPLPTNRRLPRAAMAHLPGERSTTAASPIRVDTVTVTRRDTVTVMRVDTVLVTRVDTVTRTTPGPAARRTAPPERR
jgi:hypothetical protein